MTTTILDQITTPPDPFTGEQQGDPIASPIIRVADGKLDLANIDDDLLARVNFFLKCWMDGDTFGGSMAKANVSWTMIQRAMKQSPSFKQMYDEVEDARRKTMCKRIEEAADKLATGTFEVRKGYYPPSVSAAQMLLQANDPRYKQGNQAPVSSVAIQINI